MNIKRNILLNPGPATTSDSVKLSQVVPDICPREKEFGDVMKFVSESLTDFVANNNEYTSILFGGSGTASVEAVLSSVVVDGAIFIINNGAYGKRMCDICAAYDIPYVEYVSSKTKPINLDELTLKLKESISTNNVHYLSVIHNETTTGILNDIKSIGKIASDFNLEFIVDAMSSYAAVPINMLEMNIDYLISSSNKNLQGMAGIGFVVAKLDSLQKLKNKKSRNYYLNLYAQYEHFKKTLQLRFTPPVQTIYALKEAIIELQQETISTRYARYTKSWEALHKGLEILHLNYLVPKENQSRIITTILEPECNSYDFETMHDYLYKCGFTIYPGKIGENKTFRIANIGNIDYNDINAFINVLKEYLMTINYI